MHLQRISAKEAQGSLMCNVTSVEISATLLQIVGAMPKARRAAARENACSASVAKAMVTSRLIARIVAASSTQMEAPKIGEVVLLVAPSGWHMIVRLFNACCLSRTWVLFVSRC
jgi:hypothetical protein